MHGGGAGTSTREDLQCIKTLCLTALVVFLCLLLVESVALLLGVDLLVLFARLCITVLYVLCYALKRYVQNDGRLRELPLYHYQPVLYMPMLMSLCGLVAHLLVLCMVTRGTYRLYTLLLLLLFDACLICREHRAVDRLLRYLEQQQFDLPVSAVTTSTAAIWDTLT